MKHEVNYDIQTLATKYSNAPVSRVTDFICKGIASELNVEPYDALVVYKSLSLDIINQFKIEYTRLSKRYRTRLHKALIKEGIYKRLSSIDSMKRIMNREVINYTENKNKLIIAYKVMHDILHDDPTYPVSIDAGIVAILDDKYSNRCHTVQSADYIKCNKAWYKHGKIIGRYVIEKGIYNRSDTPIVEIPENLHGSLSDTEMYVCNNYTKLTVREMAKAIDLPYTVIKNHIVTLRSKGVVLPQYRYNVVSNYHSIKGSRLSMVESIMDIGSMERIDASKLFNNIMVTMCRRLKIVYGTLDDDIQSTIQDVIVDNGVYNTRKAFRRTVNRMDSVTVYSNRSTYYERAYVVMIGYLLNHGIPVDDIDTILYYALKDKVIAALDGIDDRDAYREYASKLLDIKDKI